MARVIPNVLTIAGSDSSGGAGIQADLKTFSALGVYGASVVTALTAQNTQGVVAVLPTPADFVAAQLDAVFSDLRIDAVKIGMLVNTEIVAVVAAALKRYRPATVVLDTVMISKSGHALLADEAVLALRDTLLPICDLLTPNLPEAARLLNCEVAREETEMVRQGVLLQRMGPKAVLMKGGHLGGKHSPDWLIDGFGNGKLGAARIEVTGTHGTGCTLSAAIAALRPQRLDMASAVNDAKTYLSSALMQGPRLSVGSGIGPVHHFHAWW
jgi:hydroxymethylpyrimidine/phosphomethylpyrimidine kinase